MNDGARRANRFFEAIDAMLAGKAEAERRAAAAVAARAPSPPGTQRRTAASPTQRSCSLAERIIMTLPSPPQQEQEQRPAPLGPPAAVPPPPVARAPQHRLATAPMELPPAVLEERGRMPFKPPGEALARTVKLPQMRERGLAATADPDDAAAKAGAQAVLPFTTSTDVPLPTLEGYASFCAELEVHPERWASIFSRYQVSHEAERHALNAHWRRQFAAQPGMRAAFVEMLTGYTAWVRANPTWAPTPPTP